MYRFRQGGKRRQAAAWAIAAVTCIALACTCGPLNTLTGLQATAQSAQGTLGAFATTIDENLPTLEAQLTEVGPTIEAQLTEAGPTIEAAQTEAAAILPTVQSLTGGELRQWARAAVASSEYHADEWSAAQAAGAPNTAECADLPTAWASGTAHGVDWLRLAYETPVTPTRIEVYQTFLPGAVWHVDVTTLDGFTQVVYQAKPVLVEQCPFIVVIPVSGVNAKIDEVSVYIDQRNDDFSWSQIDAVALIGTP